MSEQPAKRRLAVRRILGEVIRLVPFWGLYLVCTLTLFNLETKTRQEEFSAVYPSEPVARKVPLGSGEHHSNTPRHPSKEGLVMFNNSSTEGSGHLFLDAYAKVHRVNHTTVPVKVYHFLQHSHTDAGWTRTMGQYYRLFVEDILQSSIDYLGTHSGFADKFSFTNYDFMKLFFESRPSQYKKELLKRLMRNSTYEVLGSSISMPDQACTYYDDLINNLEYGREYGFKHLGEASRHGWAIDNFGQSYFHSRLLAEAGYETICATRLGTTIRDRLRYSMNMNFIWANKYPEYSLFTHVISEHYRPVHPVSYMGQWTDQKITSPNWVLFKIVHEFFGNLANEYRNYKEVNVLVPMGDDFEYFNFEKHKISNLNLLCVLKSNSKSLFKNSTFLVSTADEYYKAVKSENLAYISLPQKDFLPYHCSRYDLEYYWISFFFSRPQLKYHIRTFGQLVRGVGSMLAYSALLQGRLSPTHNWTYSVMEEVRFTQGIFQHHDAITGTCYRHVARDYMDMAIKGVAHASYAATQTLKDSLFAPLAKLGKPSLLHNADLRAFLLEAEEKDLAHHQYCLGVTPLPYSSSIFAPESKREEASKKKYPVILPSIEALERVKASLVPLSYFCHSPKLCLALIELTEGLMTKFLPKTAKRAKAPDQKNSFLKPEEAPTQVVGIETEEKRASKGKNSQEAIPNHVQEFSEITLTEGQVFDWKSANKVVDTSSTIGFSYKSNILYVHLPEAPETPLGIYIGLYRDQVMDTAAISKVSTGGYVMKLFDKDPTQLSFSSPPVLTLHTDGTAMFKAYNREFDMSVTVHYDPGYPLAASRLSVYLGTGPLKTGGVINCAVRYIFPGVADSFPTFETDSNGFDFLEREYKSAAVDIESNYYPISRMIKAEGKTHSFGVLVDRAVGGTSPKPGMIEILYNRASGVVDYYGMVENTQESNSILATHRVYIHKKTHREDRSGIRRVQIDEDEPRVLVLLDADADKDCNGASFGYPVDPKAGASTKSQASKHTTDSDTESDIHSYVRTLLDLAPDGIKIRLYNLHETKNFTIDNVKEFIKQRYNIDRDIELEERSLDYNLPITEILNQTYMFRDVTAMKKAYAEETQGSKIILKPLKMKTYKVFVGK